jgi:hypothetical protein
VARRSILGVLVCLFALVPIGARSADEIRVVRHRNYEAWQWREARLDRIRAGTELIRERTRRNAIEREAQQLRNDAVRDARIVEGERTLGRACIYGREDEVLFEPEGRTC